MSFVAAISVSLCLYTHTAGRTRSQPGGYSANLLPLAPVPWMRRLCHSFVTGEQAQAPAPSSNRAPPNLAPRNCNYTKLQWLIQPIRDRRPRINGRPLNLFRDLG